MVRFSRVCRDVVRMSHPQVIRFRQLMRNDGGNTLKSQDNRKGLRTLPLNAMECDHFYVEEGLPKTRVLLWVYGEQLRAMFDNVVIAEYRCRYDWRTHKVHDIREGSFYPTRFASPQGALIPFHPQEFLVLYRPQSGRHPARKAFAHQQLLLFEVVRTA